MADEIGDDDIPQEDDMSGWEEWDNVEWGADGPYCPLPDWENNGGGGDPSGKPNKNRTDKKYRDKPGHTKNARGSTAEKHQGGDTRRKRDAGGEKGDIRRPY